MNSKNTATALRHQVGGKTPMLSSGNKIYKAVDEPELIFYKHMNSGKIPESQQFMLKYIPRFFGVKGNDEITKNVRIDKELSQRAELVHSKNVNEDSRPFIIMEDLTSGFEVPCIMDLKLGKRLYDENASEEKIARMIKSANESTIGSHGIRITGLRSFKKKKIGSSGSYEEMTSKECRRLNKDEMASTIKQFFSNGVEVDYVSVQEILGQLESFYGKIKNGMEFKFISSSALLVYDGSNKSSKKKAIFRLIDFGHTTVVENHVDEDFLPGVFHLITVLTDILKAVI